MELASKTAPAARSRRTVSAVMSALRWARGGGGAHPGDVEVVLDREGDVAERTSPAPSGDVAVRSTHFVQGSAGQESLDMPTKPFVAPGGMERPYLSY
jgi:hypothetical protein